MGKIKKNKQDKLSSGEVNKSNSISLADLVKLPEEEREFINWIRKEKTIIFAQALDKLKGDTDKTETILKDLTKQNFLIVKETPKGIVYQINSKSSKQRKKSKGVFSILEKKVSIITFPLLIFLTILSAVLLIPFVFSDIYLSTLRDNSFNFHEFIKGNLYKQITGYIAMFFVLLERILTLRKRGRGWLVSIKIPGSLLMWRGLHIFTGIALLGMTLIHTFGATGFNFNAIFLWVFFGVTLSAVIGTTTEVGILESPRKHFGSSPNKKSIIPTLKKGQLIRNWRPIWVGTHIFLVGVFSIMLVVHIFLAYYY